MGTEAEQRSASPSGTSGGGGEPVYAVSFPPAMYAGEILSNRTFARAMGYEWLHDEDTDFVRTFREQVQRQAELYQQWLDGDAAEGTQA